MLLPYVLFVFLYVGSYLPIYEFESWITGVCSPYVISWCDFAYYVFGKEPTVAMYLAIWYVVLVCYQYGVCENYVGSVYIGGYGSLIKSVLDAVVMSGDYVCCSVVFGTLVGVFVLSVMWSELLMTSAISCPLWSSVYECQRVECAFTSPVRTECGMFVMYCIQCCMSVSAVLSAWMWCLGEIYRCLLL